MIINELIKADKVKLLHKSPVRSDTSLYPNRIFFLTRAMNRAKNPEFKELWKRKKEELIKNL